MLSAGPTAGSLDRTPPGSSETPVSSRGGVGQPGAPLAVPYQWWAPLPAEVTR